MSNQLKFDDFAMIGRTYEEYCLMFNLDKDTIGNKIILDVASGVSLFCATANRLEYTVTSSDPIYSLSLDKIEQMSKQDLDKTVKQIPGISDLFVWRYFKDIKSLKKQRELSRAMFIDDFKTYGSERCVPTKYPSTKFRTNQFDISLVSHFLFLYEKLLDYDFHKKTILELLRITSKQIRVFPIVNLAGKKSSIVNMLMNDNDFENTHMSIRKVNFEFLKNGNELLIIEK